MAHPKIDFLKEKHQLVKPDEKPFLFFRKAIVVTSIVIATSGIFFSFGIRSTSDQNGHQTNLSLFSIIHQFVLPDKDLLNGEKEDRVNFLLTGIGGDGHEGGQLTDTIVFASYRPSTKKIAMLSLPRDMTVPIPNHGYQKVNHTNAYAEAENHGTGGSATAQLIGDTLKQPIQYYMRVDFNGFAEFIDTIGGVDVEIENTFTDAAYPIVGKELDSCGNSKASMSATPAELSDTTSGVAIPPPNYACRFAVMTFKKGSMHMDGETALAFTRSRHGNNGEGSDFARSRRQQKIMLAVKDKLFSASTFLNPVRITGIFDTLQKNISTNLSVSQLMRLAKEFKDLKSADVVNHVIDDSPNSPLYSTMLNGAYVLLPKNDDWTQLQKMAEYVYTPDPTTPVTTRIVESTPTPKVIPTVRVEIQNGTTVTGLAFRASQLLNANIKFNVIKVGNAVTRDYSHTVIYDLTNGAKPEDLKSLQMFLKADIADASGWMKDGQVVPQQVAVTPDDSPSTTIDQPQNQPTQAANPTPTGSKVDFLVILGQSAQNLVMN